MKQRKTKLTGKTLIIQGTGEYEFDVRQQKILGVKTMFSQYDATSVMERTLKVAMDYVTNEIEKNNIKNVLLTNISAPCFAVAIVRFCEKNDINVFSYKSENFDEEDDARCEVLEIFKY